MPSLLSAAALALVLGAATTAAEPKLTMEFTPVAHIETRGTGPVHLVLIPGLTCDWTVYQSFMERNAKLYTMHALTLPGFGGSEPPAVPTGATYGSMPWMKNAEQAVVAAAEGLHIGRPILVGHSLGGHLVMNLLEDHPDSFSGAVAIDGFAAFPLGASELTPEARVKLVEETIGPSMTSQPEEQAAAGRQAMFESMITDKERAKAIGEMSAKVPRTTTERYMLELMAGDARPGLKELQKPLLVLAAIAPEDAPGMSPVMRDRIRAIWTEQFKDAGKASVVFIEDSRHFIMDDQPAKLDGAVAGFVERVTKGAPPAIETK